MQEHEYLWCSVFIPHANPCPPPNGTREYGAGVLLLHTCNDQSLLHLRRELGLYASRSVSVKSIILILLASSPTTLTKLDFNSFFSELGYHLVLIAKQEPVPSEHGH
ncbi:hypothetical protein POTOM_014749 [Populus tomentosa]|uniref:Uncharacterized protein n=1 Tax=Populus tomentosa TaxID=118781 RepID=A0A8X8DAC4_POPTO|nr:hypothetical protein POTOM_014749 [Populus tomentosa]